MNLQDKLEGLASTALERRVIQLWLRDGRARSEFARALGESKHPSCPGRVCGPIGNPDPNRA